MNKERTDRKMGEDLKEFFDYCLEIEESYQKHWYVDDSTWTIDRVCLYSNGTIIGMYKENNSVLISLLENKYDYDELFQLICRDIDRTCFETRRMFAKCNLDKSAVPQQEYPHYGENLVEWYKGYNSYLIDAFSCVSEKQAFSLLYIYLSYSEYKSEVKEKMERDLPNIHKIYQDEYDDDFCKWNLIPICYRRRELKANDPPRIFDYQKNMTIMVDLPKSLVSIVIKLLDNKMIGKLAVRGTDWGITEGINKKQFLCEEVEKGQVYSLAEHFWPGVTKLYNSKVYDDQFWVKKTETELFFEELCDDLTIECDSVVTNMIHILFDGNEINHIDFEKIYYTLEEYNLRIKQMNVKGKGHQRRKYFKINDASIPFDFPCNVYKMEGSDYKSIQVPFIYFVLNCLFTNTELIDEYFKEILD